MQRELVERAISGDHDAFSVLARASIGRLYSIATLILRDGDRAQDAVQDALVSAWRDVRAIRDPDAWDAWLHRLTVRACYRADPARRFIREWGGFGSGNGQFVSPYGIAIDQDGNVYVSDYGSEDVQKFAPDGTWLLTFGGHGSDAGQLSFQAGVTVAPDGTIWVADFGNARIQQFTSDGAVLSEWSGGTSDGEGLKGPGAVAVDAAGWMYVADTIGHRVLVRDPAGDLAAIIGGGADSVRFADPVGIALDEEGPIYVADARLGHVRKFTMAGS
jgi:DNA-binding beta-propeller fold protein YncE